jgi:carbon-monoxide dehydrogenase medium subunit/2-furoyl-CoA dehydrogenase FAD binding subunit
MKAAVFDYIRADDVEHALELLTQHGAEAKLIAGGQTLVPMMAMRLARPQLLIDIHRLEQLRNINIESECINLGSAVRQCEVERHALLGQRLPLIHQALRWVGHQQTRNRGTVGGSLVYADPSAELPLVALTLGAQLHLENHDGSTRSLEAEDFFLGPMCTAALETELLKSIDWPVWQGTGIASAFEETAMRHGDFAMASAACQIQLDAQGFIQRASFGVGGVNGTPMVFKELAQQMLGQRMSSDLADEIAHTAAKDCEPGNDMHASAAYRRHLASVLLARVLMQAATPKK